jgi:hypothetical protein
MNDDPLTLKVPDDAYQMAESGKCACGHAALAAALQIDVEDVMPYFTGAGLWVNEARMIQAIRGMSFEAEKTDQLWSTPRVIMLQGMGSWMLPGVPMGARNQRSHWVAAAMVDGVKLIYDINSNEWMPVATWRSQVMDKLLALWKSDRYEVRAVFVAR